MNGQIRTARIATNFAEMMIYKPLIWRRGPNSKWQVRAPVVHVMFTFGECNWSRAPGSQSLCSIACVSWKRIILSCDWCWHERENFVVFKLLCRLKRGQFTRSKSRCVMAFFSGILGKLKAHSAAKCESKQRWVVGISLIFAYVFYYSCFWALYFQLFYRHLLTVSYL